jgi:hypothetical protein
MDRRRMHPLLSPKARPDVVIPIAEPHVPRNFRLPSCIGKAPALIIESEKERGAPTGKIPTRQRDGTRTAKWFRMGDTMVLPPPADEEDWYYEDSELDLKRTHRTAWRIALVVLVASTLALLLYMYS